MPTPLSGFWNADICEGVLRRPGGAISKRRPCLAMTHVCVSETRQPGSARRIGVFGVGRLIAGAVSGSNHAKQVNRIAANENPAIGLRTTPGRFATARGAVSEGRACVAMTHMCVACWVSKEGSVLYWASDLTCAAPGARRAMMSSSLAVATNTCLSSQQKHGPSDLRTH